MKILILSSETPSDSILQLQRAFIQKGHKVRIEDPRKLSLQLSPTKIFDHNLKPIICDLVIPRFGQYTLQQGLHVVRAFEATGTRIINSSDSISKSTNKLTTLSLFAKAHLPIPKTNFFHMTDSTYEDFHFSFPMVLKLPIGSQGKGVALIENESALRQWIELLRTTEKEVLLQEYLRGKDIRALVLKGQIIASMERMAPQNDFRANLSLGGVGKKIKLTQTEEQLALEAAQILGLEFCGVDLIRTRRKTFLLEANAFPGTIGVSKANKKSLNRMIASYLIEE